MTQKKTSEKIKSVLCSNSGIARAVVIAVIAVVVLLLAAGIPLYIHFTDKSGEIGCMSAMDSANKELRTAYLLSLGTLTKEEAKAEVTRAMLGWDDLCPAGGTMYIVDDPEGDIPYKIVCGIHGPDAAERTRLNANYVFEKLCDRVSKESLLDNDFPEKITVSLNGSDLDVILVTGSVFLPRGTKRVQGWEKEGVVAYYGLVETFDPDAEPLREPPDADDLKAVTAVRSDAEERVCYFAFADENYSAVWTPGSDWSGSSY